MKKTNLQNRTWIAMILVLGVIFFSSAISKKKTTTSAVSRNCTVGEVAIFAGDFAPRNWLLCDGKILQINQYSPLFSIIGTYYGGDGRTSFALPNLIGRTAIHTGTGGGLSTIQIGQVYGNPSLSNYHLYSLPIKKATGTGSEVTTVTGTDMITNTEINIQPSLGLNYIICSQGGLPTRS